MSTTHRLYIDLPRRSYIELSTTERDRMVVSGLSLVIGGALPSERIATHGRVDDRPLVPVSLEQISPGRIAVHAGPVGEP